MISALQYLGAKTLLVFESLGRAQAFLANVMSGTGYVLRRRDLLLQQVFNLGVQSLFIICAAGLFVGMVLSLQGYYFLAHYGAANNLGVFVASTLARELGPVVTALLFAGRVGSSLAAELSLMKTTQQFNAMEMMAVEPLHRIVAPRMMAGMLVLPVLSLIFTVLGIFGSYLVALANLHLDSGVFWASMQDQVKFFADILTGVAKSLVFSVVVSWVALYQGYYSNSGGDGMAAATTRSVVYASIIVLGFDVLLTALMYVG